MVKSLMNGNQRRQTHARCHSPYSPRKGAAIIKGYEAMACLHGYELLVDIRSLELVDVAVVQPPKIGRAYNLRPVRLTE